MQNILKDCLIVKASNGASAGTSTVNSNIVDAKGYNAVCWLVDMGGNTTGAVITATAQDNTANSSTGMTAVGTAATYTDVAGESANTLLITEVINSQKRYQRCQVTRATQNSVINTIIGIFFQTDTKPVTLDASVIASALANAAN